MSLYEIYEEIQLTKKLKKNKSTKKKIMEELNKKLKMEPISEPTIQSNYTNILYHFFGDSYEVHNYNTGNRTDLYLEFKFKELKELPEEDKIDSFLVIFDFKKEENQTLEVLYQGLFQCLLYHINLIFLNPIDALKVKFYCCPTQNNIFSMSSTCFDLFKKEFTNIISAPHKGYSSFSTVYQKFKSIIENELFKNAIDDNLFDLELLKDFFLSKLNHQELQIPVNNDNLGDWFNIFRTYVLRESNDNINVISEPKIRSQIAAFLRCIEGHSFEQLTFNNSILYNIESDGSRTPTYNAVKFPDAARLKDFLRKFEMNCSKSLIANADILLYENYSRRTKGDFYTPLIWVKESYKFISNLTGDVDWKKHFLIWDASCGTGNLTVMEDFNYLIQSTFFEQDISSINSRKINVGSFKMTYNFLSELEFPPSSTSFPPLSTIPTDLKSFLSKYNPDNGKKVFLFYNNPPYTTGAAFRKRNNGEDMPSNAITVDMAAKKNVCLQFLHKINAVARTISIVGIGENKLDEIYNAIFLPTNIWSGSQDYKYLKEKYFFNWEYKGGFVFSAAEFDVKGGSTWSVSFTLWKYKKNLSPNLRIDLILKENNNNMIKDVGTTFAKISEAKDLLNSWWKIPRVNANDKVPIVPLSSAIIVGKTVVRKKNNSDGTEKIIKKKRYISSWKSNSIAFFASNSNNIQCNVQGTYLLSSAYFNGNGGVVLNTEDQFLKSCASFFVRRAIILGKDLWKFWHLDYFFPKTFTLQDSEFKRWCINCVVFCIFDSKSLQTSLRNMKFDDDDNNIHISSNIRNHFFFLSKNDMLTWARSKRFVEMVQDLDCYAGESYSYLLLQKYNSSLYAESSNLLKKAKTIWENSILSRLEKKDMKLKSKSDPTEENSLFLYAWDAGYYQIKQILDNDTKKEINNLLFDLKKKLFPGILNYKFLQSDLSAFIFQNSSSSSSDIDSEEESMNVESEQSEH